MAIGGAFLGGGVEVVPAGSCKLELEILTEDRANLTATFTIKGTSTYTVTAGADGRAVYTIPAGQTYTVSVNATGYDNLASQTVIAESGTVRYVRFEAIAGRVKRSGDTMTGGLSTRFLNVVSPSLDKNTTKPSATTNVVMTFKAKDGSQLGGFANFTQASGNRVTYMKTVGIDGTTEKRLDIWHLPDNTAYLTFPSWSVGTNDNSDKILTIKMANSLPSLVHTTGNETVAGVKTFSSRAIFTGGRIRLINPSLPSGTAPSTTIYDQGLLFEDSAYMEVASIFHQVNKDTTDAITNITSVSNGPNRKEARLSLISKEDGTAYVTIPTTPSGATGREIATAGWVISKMANKIRYGTGDPPSGGQAGDIYIKI